MKQTPFKRKKTWTTNYGERPLVSIQYNKNLKNSTFKKKKPEEQSPMAILDGIFSKVIRMSAANIDGMAPCVTCGKSFYWKCMDTGHWVPRANLATRYDIRNVGPQCQTCNRFNDGEVEKFEQYIAEFHGKNMPWILKSKAREIVVSMPWDDLIFEWSGKLAALVAVQENSIEY